MFIIRKNHEPVELVEYKMKKDSSYDGPGFTEIKIKVKENLLQEQGYLCAYCMCRIDREHMKLEHWAPQSKNRHLALDYKNMLACCLGNDPALGEKPRDKEKTCDTKKADSDLMFNPSDASHYSQMQVFYSMDGHIYSKNQEFNVQLKNILNLNYSRLKKNRQAVMKGIQSQLDYKDGTRSAAELTKLLDKYKQRDSSGKYSEYYGVKIYYLEKKIKK